MVSKLATFRTDSDIWDSFQDKAKSNGTNASALLQRYLRDYLDDELDSRIDSRIDSTAAPDVDIESIVNKAVESRLDAVLTQVRDFELKLHSLTTDKLITENLQANLTVAQQRIEALEAIATEKKPLTLSQNQKVIAIQKLQATA
jgi:hypothetical protein